MIPLRDENPSHSAPLATRTFIGINGAAFLYELMLGLHLREFLFEWGMIPARVTLALQGGHEPMSLPAVTFLTSTFLHGGWLHLIGNMWYLHLFGDNVEDRLGRVRFVLFFLAAGLVGGLTHYLADPFSRLPTVGASGAVAGVLGAYVVAFPRARVLTLVPLFPFFHVMALPALVVLGFWFVFQFFSGALSLGGGSGGGVAWWAHIGGFIFGVVVMKIVGRRRNSRAWEP